MSARLGERDLFGVPFAVRDALYYANMDVVVREAKAAALVVACWGAGTWDEYFVEHVLEEIQSGHEPWPDIHCLGRSADSSPLHPMARGRHRVPDDAHPQLWRANA